MKIWNQREYSIFAIGVLCGGVVAVILILSEAGCDSANPVPRAAEAPDASSHCQQVDVATFESACWKGEDGNLRCHYTFIQPIAWGRCLQSKDKSLLCEASGSISHYPDDAERPDWTIATSSCQVLDEQIRWQGQNPLHDLPSDIAPR